MRTFGRVVLSAAVFFLLFLFIASAPRAQMRSAPVAVAHPAVHAIAMRPIVVRPAAAHALATPRARVNTAVQPSAQPAGARIVTVPTNDIGSNTFPGIGGAGETLQQLLDPVPGLGFNYAHVAALDRDLDIKAVIDPETQWRLAVAERVLRDTGGFASPGFFLLDGGGAYIMPAESAPEEQPQQSQPPEVIVLQQPAQNSAEAEPAPAAAPPPSAPIPDVGNFTLVLRNGKKIEVVAFTRTGDRLAYITADGERHTIATSAVDAAATQRVNEDSGKQLTL